MSIYTIHSVCPTNKFYMLESNNDCREVLTWTMFILETESCDISWFFTFHKLVTGASWALCSKLHIVPKHPVSSITLRSTLSITFDSCTGCPKENLAVVQAAQKKIRYKMLKNQYQLLPSEIQKSNHWHVWLCGILFLFFLQICYLVTL